MTKLTFSFLGLGLIGGSIAKAIRLAFPKAIIYAYDINKETLSSSTKEGIVSKSFFQLEAQLAQCDYLFLCGPILDNIKNLTSLKKYLSTNCLITDVASVKGNIHQAISNLNLEQQFIGGHPMAGSEQIGYDNSSNRLLENAYYILTPTSSVNTVKVKDFASLITTIGALPLILTAEEHDYATAAISHLPHIIAASLVNLVQSSDSKEELMKLIAAGGFKDITRIASSSPIMWQHISLANQKNISKLLATYISSLQQLELHLAHHKEKDLLDFFATAKDYRESFGELSSGALEKSYGFYVDIPDETGIIATIATLLAKESINIKNIGIVHNREFEEGVLRIEFYEEATSIASEAILKNNNFTIYRRK